MEKKIEGSSAIETEYEPLWSNGRCTLLEVHLITGKTHQIRAHLASQGHAIVGDYKYGNSGVNHTFQSKYGLKSQLLHAYRLELPKLNGELGKISEKQFLAPLPKLFSKIIMMEQSEG